MATLPTRSAITDGTTTNAQQKTNLGDQRDFIADLLGTDSSDKAAARAALGIGAGSGRRKNINGDFSINQLAITSPVTLAAGAYGHDGFKAGAAGCTYSFATVANKTTITITAGELLSVVDGLDLQSGTHVLDHEGTAQVKIDAGSYAAAPVTATLTGGTNATLAFGIGTVILPQLEPGSEPSAFEYRRDERDLCEVQCQHTFALGTAPATGVNVGAVQITSTGSGNKDCFTWIFRTPMRGTPTTVTTYNPVSANANWRDTNALADRTAVVDLSSNKMVAITSNPGSNGNLLRIHIMVERRL